MDAVLRASVIYLALLVLFRLAGKRTLADITPFDFVLLLIVGEATQQGLLGNDFSLTNALLVITTLLALDIGASLLKERLPRFGRALEGLPVVLVDDGRVLHDQLKRSRIDEGDVLEAARQLHGLGTMAEVRYAILERTGGISIVPRQPESAGPQS